MAYDLLIKNGRIVDGSGMPSFHGDVAVKNGKIAEIGKLSGAAEQVVDAGGQAVAPGFIDNHCHYDAQVTWDPLCSFSCDHGATSVVIGNCSLSLAPVRKGKATRMAEFLSYVEAIPMEVLNTIEVDWETFPQYMDRLDQNLGVNVGTLVGHTAVRYYVMGDECQKRAATDAEMKAMQEVVRDSMEGGALGLSVSRNQGHYDPQGVHIPALWADEKEIFALADVLREMGTGIIQSGGGRDAEMKDGLMARLSEATGRPVIYNNLGQSVRRPGDWQKHMDAGQRDRGAGHPRLPAVLAEHDDADLQHGEHAGVPRLADLAPDPASSDDEKLRAYADPAVRAKLHEEMVEWKVEIPGNTISREWYNYIWVEEPKLEKNKWMTGQDPEPDRPGAEQAHHRLVPRSGRRGKARNRVHAGREQHRPRGDARDPELPERADRPVGRRRACAVPRRLRLLDPAPRRVGARKAGHEPRKRGAPADLQLGLDLRPL